MVSANRSDGVKFHVSFHELSVDRLSERIARCLGGVMTQGFRDSTGSMAARLDFDGCGCSHCVSILFTIIVTQTALLYSKS